MTNNAMRQKDSSDSFPSRYLGRVAKTNSVLCVGLDPTEDHVPLEFRTGDPIFDIRRYLYHVVELAAVLAPVVKPQLAYYEALGTAGEEMLVKLIEYAHRLGLLVIIDAKPSDIGDTMVRYGKKIFDRYNADACTFVPYLGPTFNPAWLPWLGQGRMVISMIRTSNPEAEVLQDLVVEGGADGLKVYGTVAASVSEWNEKVRGLTNGAGSVGGVVGATWPAQAPECRKLAGPDVFFLIPGYGAQGGGSDGAVAGLPNRRVELMGTVNSSRGITLTSWWDSKEKKPREGRALDLVEAAIKEANADLNAALARKHSTSPA